MTYDPTIGRWISEDPIGFTAADENLYRYVGNNPTNLTDPSGLDWLDPTNHDVGYTYHGPEAWDPNCLGASLGRRESFTLGYFEDKSFVPHGFREVDPARITKWITPCRAGERELIVAWAYDKGAKINVFHSVARDRDSLHRSWESKMGNFGARGEGLAASGSYVKGIRDFRAHFAWYFKQTCNVGPADIHYRAFCYTKGTEVIVRDGVFYRLSDLPPGVIRLPAPRPLPPEGPPLVPPP